MNEKNYTNRVFIVKTFLLSLTFCFIFTINGFTQCIMSPVYNVPGPIAVDGDQCTYLVYLEVEVIGAPRPKSIHFEAGGIVVQHVSPSGGLPDDKYFAEIEVTATCDEPIDVSITGYTNNSGGTGGECGFYDGSVTEGGGALPVDLVSFTARERNTWVDLEWVTASELNNDYFIVEHSTGGADFTEIMKMDGSGTTEIVHYYSYTDSRPKNGSNYYRLKQVDYDGTFAYSDIVAVKMEIEDIKVKLIPTNVNSNLSVLFYEVYDEKAAVEVFDILGNNVLNAYLAEGESEINFDVSSLIPGSYVVRIRGERDFIIKRFNKLKL